jgi:hypothetical protein
MYATMFVLLMSINQPSICFADDWPNGNWWQSNDFVVKPGDVIYSELSYDSSSNSYNMLISNTNSSSAVVKSVRPVIDQQTYTDVYFVTEHQPDSCTEYPASGGIVFYNIHIAWENRLVVPAWEAHTFQPACNSQAHVISPSSVAFTWDTS